MTVLIADRGEVAVRIARTLRRLGIRSVAVHTADDAVHAPAADLAVAVDSYRSIEGVLRAARLAGAETVHPGYGFLSENAAFAEACEKAGLVFVGPPAAAISMMGDKIRARRAVAAAGVPVVPGSDAPADAELLGAVARIGYPVLVKPSAGGGGKGMHEVYRPEDLPGALATARREARASFGDGTLFVEKLITRPRHIEIQVLADLFGNVTHLGERECSLQRRHQKVVEECPSPLLTPAQREAMGRAAGEVARSCGYVGVGTVEFIVTGDRPDEWFFMEMNTRLQVEHPVTEEVYGVDLVEIQIRIARGEVAPWPADPQPRGHAIEARVYAEDPASGFLPTAGPVLVLRTPGDVRVDSGIAEGLTVGTTYDPMLAKVIAHGHDREEARRRLDSALGRTVVLGLPTNIGFLRALLADPDVRSGRLDTGLIERHRPVLTATTLPDDVIGLAGGLALLDLEPPDPARADPFDLPGGWRLGDPAWTTLHLEGPTGEPIELRHRGRGNRAEISIDGAPPVTIRTEPLDPRRIPTAVGPAPDGHRSLASPGTLPHEHPGPTAHGEPSAPQHRRTSSSAHHEPDDPRPHRGDLTDQGETSVLKKERISREPNASLNQPLSLRSPGGASGLAGRRGPLVLGEFGIRHTQDGLTRTYWVAREADGLLWVGRDGLTWAVRERPVLEDGGGAVAGGDGRVCSPMPGTVTVVAVGEGERVTAGQRLVVVEAMKMEHALTAPVDGLVRELRVRVGATIAKGAVLMTIEGA